MPQIIDTDDRPYLKEETGGLIFLSGGFGSEIDKAMREAGIPRESCIHGGSGFVAPLDVPKIVEWVHESYAKAGAGILTTETFNANIYRQKRAIEKNENITIEITDPRVYRLTSEFVRAGATIAQNVSLKNPGTLVALSLTSAGDCYDSNDTPDPETLLYVHTKDIEILSPHGNFILAETIPSIREAQVIARLSQQAKKPFMVTFSVDDKGLVRDGSKMIEAVDTVLQRNSYCMGVGINCCSIEGAHLAVSELSQIFKQQGLYAAGKHIAVYPNGFKKSVEENGEKHHHDHAYYTAEEFTSELRNLVDRGATMIGGCCGTTPEHTKAYAQLSSFVHS
jgi:homocysteine S-methyltransferase